MSRCSTALVSFLCWLLSALATAVLAHAALALSACFLAEPEYATHAHIAVGPAAVTALSIGVGLLLTVVLRALGEEHARDPFLLLATQFSTMRPLVPIILVAAGGLSTLVAMEFVEQIHAFGHVTGVVDALDGNAALGIAIVAAIASVIGYLGLRCARMFIARVVAIVDEIVAWLVADGALASPVMPSRAGSRSCSNCSCAHFARCLGLRAPPPLLV